MRKRILYFLNKHPKLNNLAEALYSIPSGIGYLFRGSKYGENYWSVRHLNKQHSHKDDWGEENTDWIEAYRKSINHAHRKFLTEKISAINPASILEIGCNCGPNLHLLAEKFPTAEIIGIDINPLAVQKGNEWFESEKINNIKLLAGKADELDKFADKKFDVVFTDAVLIYLGPDKIRKAISEMFQVSAKALILLEWNDFSGNNGSLGKFRKHWVRDYKTLLAEFVKEDAITIEKLPDGLWSDNSWKKYGALIEVIVHKEN